MERQALSDDLRRRVVLKTPAGQTHKTLEDRGLRFDDLRMFLHEVLCEKAASFRSGHRAKLQPRHRFLLEKDDGSRLGHLDSFVAQTPVRVAAKDQLTIRHV